MAASSSTRDNSEPPADEILQFYRSLEWTTRTPPPLTVYLQPYLQDLLKRRSQTPSKPPPLEEDQGRSLRHSPQPASSGPTPAAVECRAPCTPPGAASSQELAARGRLPSRPRAPKRARTRSRSATSRKPSRRPSGRPSRKPSSSSPSRRGRETPAARSKAEIHPKPKRYPLAPPETPRQPASDTRTPLASSPSTMPSESSAATNSPGALIGAFFKTTDTAAQRVYTARCTCALLCSLPSCDLNSSIVLQVYPALGHTRVPVYFFLWQGPQTAAPLGIQCQAVGLRLLCDIHAAEVLSLPRLGLCLNRCSHCRTSLRIPPSRPKHFHSPSLRSCRPQTTWLSVHLATARQMLPPFLIPTRSWLLLILQPVRPCCKEWLIEQLELHVVRSLARRSRCPFMTPSRVRLKPQECVPRRRRFDAGADPREPLHIRIARLLLPSRTRRVRHWMQITSWRSVWTPPGPSFSTSRSVFSPPGLPRLPKQSGIRVICPLPVLKALAPCQRQMICTQLSGKSNHSFDTVTPQLCDCLARSNPLCALSSWLHPWLRLSQKPPLCLSLPCPWVRPSALQLHLTVHWTLAPARLWLTSMHRCQSAQDTPHPPLSPQVVPPLESSLSHQRPCAPRYDPWQSHPAACPWTPNSSTPLSTRPNLNKQLKRLNLKRWRFCQPPLQQSPPRPLLPRTSQPLSPSRHQKARIVDKAAAAALCDLSRTTPWNRPLRRTSKSTCRSPSEAFLDECIPKGRSTSIEGYAPALLFTGPLYQGAARTLSGQVKHWRRLSKCTASSSLPQPQHEHRMSSNGTLSLSVILRSRACLTAALHATPPPHRWLCTPSCNGLLGPQCSSWSCCTSAQNLARCLASPSAVGAEMATRKERRQERQRSRPGSLNRRFTAPSEAEAEAGADTAASSTATPTADSTAPAADPSPSLTSSATLAEPCRLTVKEVALLNYVQWQGRTGKPPPLTVYAEPSLQQVLRGLRQKKRQPLPPPKSKWWPT